MRERCISRGTMQAAYKQWALTVENYRKQIDFERESSNIGSPRTIARAILELRKPLAQLHDVIEATTKK